jgi:hypothetical protein
MGITKRGSTQLGLTGEKLVIGKPLNWFRAFGISLSLELLGSRCTHGVRFSIHDLTIKMEDLLSQMALGFCEFVKGLLLYAHGSMIILL